MSEPQLCERGDLCNDPDCRDGQCGAHAYGCRCPKCVGMASAICAQLPDGSDFFTDDELLKLAIQP